MSCRQTNRRTIVEVVCLTICMCQIDISCLHCCTCPKAAVPSHHRARRAAPSRACRPGHGLTVYATTPSTCKVAPVCQRLLDCSSPSSTLSQAVGHLTPPIRACRCPCSLSTASLTVGSCLTAPPSRCVFSPSRIPSAELPEPPLTGKHELCVLDPGRDTACPHL
jgi:hypothetical protein